MDPSISRFCVAQKACTRSKRQERRLYHHCGSSALVFELSCLGCTCECSDTRAGLECASCPVSHDLLEQCLSLRVKDIDFDHDTIEVFAWKYPSLSKEWSWYWLFPARSPCTNIRTGEIGYWHMHPSVIQKKIKEGISQAGITKMASAHTLRHSFATHLKEGCS